MLDELYNLLDKIYDALYNPHTSQDKRNILGEVSSFFNNIFQVQNYVSKLNLKEYNMTSSKPIWMLSDYEINCNLISYFKAIIDFIRKNFGDFPSTRSINTLYFNPNPFDKRSVIYANNKGSLTVDDLLKVCEYTIKVIELGYDVNLEEYSLAVDFFKEISDILNNKKTAKPRNKSLHYANTVLKKIKAIDGEMALLIELTIDFFVTD